MKKRLKIAEQILIILSMALILPLVIAGAIIINTNQIAVRKELVSSATIIANSVSNELVTLKSSEKNNLFYFDEALKKMPAKKERQEFIEFIKSNDENVIDFTIENLPQNLIVKNKYNSIYIPQEQTVVFSLIDKQNTMINKKVKVKYIQEKIFDDFKNERREIYILDKNKNLIMAKDENNDHLQEILKVFPQKISPETPTIFGKYKNQPNILLYSEDFDWYVIVSSPKFLTYYGIIEARRKIIFAICIAAITVFILFGFYTYYLYKNIRQIFKAIKAVTAGNYTRKIRALTNFLTSQEVIFITDEFNKMIEKIDESYSELNESNLKLKKMDEYKSNLIDTVSHEFRTPLTSIKGYASSLLRHDIHIDEESKKKSLKIIKHQAERLSRMVEDLLVIPDIESATLRMNYKEVNLKNIIETSILSTSKADTSIFEVNINEPIKTLYSDEDRLIQIFINLLENALKYSKEDTTIKISASTNEDFATIIVHNEAEVIDEKILNELFEKFTRIDSDLTRTTRGTGLGLFIVKGLVETMGGTISLSAKNGFDVTFTIPTFKGQSDEA